MDVEAEAFFRTEWIQFGLLAMGVGARDMCSLKPDTNWKSLSDTR